jgi:AcrR family transcriptional regulator
MSTAEGLRERKKRQMRQHLSDTATEMFVERGFEAVRVAEVADACGVSEKTVFNYFPTKESLVLDLPDATLVALRALADPRTDPITTTLTILATELAAMTGWLDQQPDRAAAIAKMHRFGELLRSTPALQAHQNAMTAELTAAAAEALGERTGTDPADPEPQITATALLGLWPIQFRAIRKHLDATHTTAQVVAAVTAEVQRAAQLLRTGL